MRTNLVDETLECLRENGKTPADVRWIGIEGENECTWEEFDERWHSFVYDDGYGGVEVNPNLVVVGEDWWLERVEYDGSEWWDFKKQPVKPREHKVPNRLKVLWGLDTEGGGTDG